MDNLTHSLTGALAAKLIETTFPALAEEPSEQRKKFWLLVGSANFPDIDVALGLLGDPILAIQHHRGLTHSLLFAPIFALLPAMFFFILGKRKNFKIFWFYGLIGILVHIFFDLITPFGTQLFMPLSTARFSLDLMFIIDPFFTGILGLTLLLGKIFKPPRRSFLFGGVFFAGLYLLLEVVNHHRAYQRIEAALQRDGIAATKISALPQPLSIFSWMGLAQTEDGVTQTFLSLLNDETALPLTKYNNANDEFVTQALQAPETQWYWTFARHPWIISERRGDRQVVEMQDLQFSFDQRVLQTAGIPIPKRRPPFLLQYNIAVNGGSTEIVFNGKLVQPSELQEPAASAP